MEACRLIATDIACRRGERLLFRGLSFELAEGSAIQVTGPNGTGKSSLIRILGGLLRPFAGSVERLGAVALLDERPALDGDVSLQRALRFWSAVDGNAPGRIDELGLAPLLDLPVKYLSTGQRKRAALARLAGQPARLWLLDEPLNGLDREAAATCQTLVSRHCAGGGIAVVASHQPFALRGMSTLSLPEYAA